MATCPYLRFQDCAAFYAFYSSRLLESNREDLHKNHSHRVHTGAKSARIPADAKDEPMKGLIKHDKQLECVMRICLAAL